MAIAEIVTPVLKSNHKIVSIFKFQLLPLLHIGLFVASGIQNRQVFGHMLYENNKPVSDYRLGLGLKWDYLEQFVSFMKQDDFQAFVEKLKPHVAGPIGPQIYDTDSSPAAIFASSVTEVLRMPALDMEKEEVVRTA